MASEAAMYSEAPEAIVSLILTVTLISRLGMFGILLSHNFFCVLVTNALFQSGKN